MRKIEKLSPTAINTWESCPFKYYCHYLDKREQIKTPDTATFGLTVHNIIDHYYDLAKPDMKFNEVPELIEKAYTQLGNYSTQRRKTSTITTQKSLLRFEKKRINGKYGLPTIREKMLSAKISDDLPLIYGKTDVYFDSVGLIIDWKTGNWAELSDSLKIQGKIYKLLLEANGYSPKIVVFDFLVKGKRVTLPEVSTDWLIGKMEDMMIGIKNRKFPKISSPLCTKWCGYRLDCDLDGSCPWVIP